MKFGIGRSAVKVVEWNSFQSIFVHYNFV